ncbi:MAG: SDR family oxidoreductase [Anaerolineae bacterium]|nr:SDR family oxidoreductase [Anaerolineae bacterium]
MSLKGQVAVITGASRGIGRASALALAREGVHVVVTARTESELDSLLKEIAPLGVKGKAVVADVAQEADVKKLRDEALAAFPQVDIVVNNAGVAKYASLLEHSADDYDWMMNTNMRSTFLVTHAFLPEMLERKSGTVIVVSSQAGVRGFPNEVVYCASKFAQVGFAMALDNEVRERGVKVSIIAPGGVHTTFAFGTGRTPDMPQLQGMLDAEDVAEAVVFAARQSPKSRILFVGMRPMSEPS